MSGRLRLKAPNPSEAQVMRAVRTALNVLQSRGVVNWWMRANSGKAWANAGQGKLRPIALAERGTSDIVGMLANGRAFFIEVKSPTGRATPEQLEFLKERARAGAIACIVRSSDDVFDALKEEM